MVTIRENGQPAKFEQGRKRKEGAKNKVSLSWTKNMYDYVTIKERKRE